MSLLAGLSGALVASSSRASGAAASSGQDGDKATSGFDRVLSGLGTAPQTSTGGNTSSSMSGTAGSPRSEDVSAATSVAGNAAAVTAEMLAGLAASALPTEGLTSTVAGGQVGQTSAKTNDALLKRGTPKGSTAASPSGQAGTPDAAAQSAASAMIVGGMLAAATTMASPTAATPTAAPATAAASKPPAPRSTSVGPIMAAAGGDPTPQTDQTAQRPATTVAEIAVAQHLAPAEPAAANLAVASPPAAPTPPRAQPSSDEPKADAATSAVGDGAASSPARPAAAHAGDADTSGGGDGHPGGHASDAAPAEVQPAGAAASDGVPFAAMSATQTAEGAPAASDASARPSLDPATPTTVAPAPVRTLTLQITPPDMAPVDVRMHMAEAGLDVHLSIADQQTLGAVSRERDTLSSALQGQTYNLHSLVIQDAGASSAGGQHASSGFSHGAGAGADTQAGNRGADPGDGRQGQRRGDGAQPQAGAPQPDRQAAGDRGGALVV